MRIAYIAPQFHLTIRGPATIARQLAVAMAEGGHEVLVIAGSDKSEPYPTRTGSLIVLRLRSQHNPMRVGQRFLLYPGRAVLSALNEFQPDIIHGHCSLQTGIIALEYGRGARIPVTLTNHQVPGFVAGCSAL